MYVPSLPSCSIMGINIPSASNIDSLWFVSRLGLMVISKRWADCEEVHTVEDLVAAIEAEQEAALAGAAAKFASDRLDLDNMVPKKANWDLKRALAPRLERLERRTQRALRAIARESAQKQAAADGDEYGRLARAVADAELEASDND